MGRKQSVQKKLIKQQKRLRRLTSQNRISDTDPQFLKIKSTYEKILKRTDDQQQLAEAGLVQAKSYLAVNRCDEAMEACQSAMKKMPNLLDVHIVEGQILIAQGQFAEANRRPLARCMVLNPHDPRVLDMRFLLHVAHGQYELAMTALQSVVPTTTKKSKKRELNEKELLLAVLQDQESVLNANLDAIGKIKKKNRSDLLSSLYYYGKLDYAQALSYLADHLQPDDQGFIFYRLLRIKINMSKADFDRALPDIQGLQALLPTDNYRIRYLEAACYKNLGCYDEAIACYRNILLAFPEDVISYQALHDIYQMLGENERDVLRIQSISSDHIEVLETLIRLAPDPKYLHEIGKIYVRLGRMDEAIITFESIVDETIDEGQSALRNLLLLYWIDDSIEDLADRSISLAGADPLSHLIETVFSRDPKDADKQFQKLAKTELFQNDPLFWLAGVRLYMLLGAGKQGKKTKPDMIQRSKDCIAKVKREIPAAPLVYMFAGELELLLDRSPVEHYQCALEVSPDYEPAHRALVLWFFDQVNFAAADAHALWFKKHPNVLTSSALAMTLGELNLYQGRLDTARHYCQRGLELVEEYDYVVESTCHLNLGIIAFMLSNWALAGKHFQLVVFDEGSPEQAECEALKSLLGYVQSPTSKQMPKQLEKRFKKLCKRVKKDAPRAQFVHFLAALSAYHTKRHKKARALMKVVSKMQEGDIAYNQFFVWLFSTLLCEMKSPKKIAEGRRLLKAGFEHNPDSLLLSRPLVPVYADEHNWSGLATVVENLRVDEPASAEWESLLGFAYYYAGHLARAVSHFAHARDLEPDAVNIDALKACMIALALLGEHGAANLLYEECARREDRRGRSDFRSKFITACHEFTTQDYVGARKSFGIALQHQLNLGGSKKKRKNFRRSSKSDASLQEGIMQQVTVPIREFEVHFLDYYAQCILAWMTHYEGNSDEAVTTLSVLSASDPGNPVAPMLCGEIEAERRHEAGLLEWYPKALALMPHDYYSQIRYAELLLSQGLLEPCLQIHRTLPDDVRLLRRVRYQEACADLYRGDLTSSFDALLGLYQYGGDNQHLLGSLLVPLMLMAGDTKQASRYLSLPKQGAPNNDPFSGFSSLYIKVRENPGSYNKHEMPDFLAQLSQSQPNRVYPRYLYHILMARVYTNKSELEAAFTLIDQSNAEYPHNMILLTERGLLRLKLKHDLLPIAQDLAEAYAINPEAFAAKQELAAVYNTLGNMAFNQNKLEAAYDLQHRAMDLLEGDRGAEVLYERCRSDCNRVEDRAYVDKRFEQVEKRLTSLEFRVDRLEIRVDNIEQAINKIVECLSGVLKRLDAHDRFFGVLCDRIATLEYRQAELTKLTLANTEQLQQHAQVLQRHEQRLDNHERTLLVHDQQIRKNAANIATNSRNIARNRQMIHHNRALIGINANNIARNRRLIGINANNIANNARNIRQNARNIAINRRGIAMNRQNIARNAANIFRNALGIRKNAMGIRKNALGIRKNAMGIHRNALGIRKNAMGIRLNAQGIRKNAMGIRFNRRMIGENRSHIFENRRQIAVNRKGIQQNRGAIGNIRSAFSKLARGSTATSGRGRSGGVSTYLTPLGGAGVMARKKLGKGVSLVGNAGYGWWGPQAGVGLEKKMGKGFSVGARMGLFGPSVNVSKSIGKHTFGIGFGTTGPHVAFGRKGWGTMGTSGLDDLADKGASVMDTVKDLGGKMPDMPALSDMPTMSMPEMPPMSDITAFSMPEMPSMPDVSTVSMPEIPSIPDVSTADLASFSMPELPPVPELPPFSDTFGRFESALPDLPTMPTFGDDTDMLGLPTAETVSFPELPQVHVSRVEDIPNVAPPVFDMPDPIFNASADMPLPDLGMPEPMENLEMLPLVEDMGTPAIPEVLLDTSSLPPLEPFSPPVEMPNSPPLPSAQEEPPQMIQTSSVSSMMSPVSPDLAEVDDSMEGPMEEPMESSGRLFRDDGYIRVGDEIEAEVITDALPDFDSPRQPLSSPPSQVNFAPPPPPIQPPQMNSWLDTQPGSSITPIQPRTEAILNLEMPFGDSKLGDLNVSGGLQFGQTGSTSATELDLRVGGKWGNLGQSDIEADLKHQFFDPSTNQVTSVEGSYNNQMGDLKTRLEHGNLKTGEGGGATGHFDRSTNKFHVDSIYAYNKDGHMEFQNHPGGMKGVLFLGGVGGVGAGALSKLNKPLALPLPAWSNGGLRFPGIKGLMPSRMPGFNIPVLNRVIKANSGNVAGQVGVRSNISFVPGKGLEIVNKLKTDAGASLSGLKNALLFKPRMEGAVKQTIQPGKGIQKIKQNFKFESPLHWRNPINGNERTFNPLGL